MALNYESTLQLSSEYVIDACIHPLPEGGHRLWYKDEFDDSMTYYADSSDLHHWEVNGRAVEGEPHEGPNVFELAGCYWMLTDEWHGQRVRRSRDLTNWEAQGLILDKAGVGADDSGCEFYADVVTRDGDAIIFYFTHPDRFPWQGIEIVGNERRTSIQAARLYVSGDTLRCDRDASLPTPFLF